MENYPLEQPAMSRDLLKVLIFGLLGWVILLLIFTQIYRASLQPSQPQESIIANISLPAYPGAYDLRRRQAPDGEWKAISYRVRIDYPSRQVVDFYHYELTSSGWHKTPAAGRPQWQRSVKGTTVKATLQATWLDERELRRIDLRLTWEGEYRKGLGRSRITPKPGGPEMQVLCMASRNPLPRRQSERR